MKTNSNNPNFFYSYLLLNYIFKIKFSKKQRKFGLINNFENLHVKKQICKNNGIRLY